MTPLADYLAELRKSLAHGDATEHTHRPALKTLLESAGQGVTATNEPTRILCGAPDFNITRGKVPFGHVETKDLGANLDEMERGKGPHGEQFKRYRAGLPNWILTDYLDFRWFVNGEKRLSARLAELDSKGKLRALPEAETQLAQLLTAFFNQEALTVGTAKDLAQRTAGITHIIRDLIIGAFEHEQEKGWLHNWLAAFREVLIPDLDEKQFADMFAQTLAYGLFAACVNTPAKEQFTRQSAAYAIPKTNPFLRKLFSEIAGVDMPDAIAWAVDDLVDLLKHADMAEILRDFGKGTGKHDPVIHFYETFLAAYDPEVRDVRGVRYTPEPVVSYIVRSIDYLLKTRFNRPKGLADENTLMLDPATGTATFHYFVIQLIYQQFARQKGAWDDYVAKHLLNRLFGFELLMAPYAIAHLKLGMLLEQTGYHFGSDQRLGIYLTNTLEHTAKQVELRFAEFIAKEANAAAGIKDAPVLEVVLGNPPYSGHSANKGAWIAGLLRGKDPAHKSLGNYFECDGKPLGERNPKWLNDDYVKFIRFAQWRVEKTGYGIVGYITNHSYLDNPTFRGMRQSLMQTFSEIYVYDLHGSTKPKESSPGGIKDENVFDIQKGVAIILCVKESEKTQLALVNHADLWGERDHKYALLSETDVAKTQWRPFHPEPPFYLFRPQDTRRLNEYHSAIKVTEVFGVSTMGVVTGQDTNTIAWDRNEANQKAKALGLGEDVVVEFLYRPFDTRFLVYSPSVVTRPRFQVMQHMLASSNVALLTNRQVRTDFRHVLCSPAIIDSCTTSLQSKERTYIFPLYLYDLEKRKKGDWGKVLTMALFEPSPGYHTRRPNLNPAFLKALAEKLKLPQTESHGLPEGITPEDIFHYSYAAFHSPTYRTRYAEFLKIDFPRLPLTNDLKLFRALAQKGAELVALHLMESPKLNDFFTEFPAKGDNEVEKVQYTDNDQRVWISPKQYFGGVPKAVWEFHVGGYQVCEKWLKDRKGRKLSYDDTQHYQKIVVALSETIRLMAEIEALVPAWPIA